ncbi:MAG: methionine--tRNA ligase [Methanocalculus sp. MSAO_Arc1]|uniref:methionine--tRNA ligase n=1 Tax=Methanocalculus TaxID=71151 RepID=UPI000FEF9CB8|nr:MULTISPECIES: methionine--tRNA ligase [unclassified Methanocalculus]MCP1662439.1 methionyl-tRNA synthetase [Methanocalculus sp. AMF5]RQD79500.1 MAG: methionine--tRNA ligase [Methanocalculus sp. MSAO_Arc1]
MSGKPKLVTCGLPYTNGLCHIGHLRTYVPADCYVRYLRRAGEDVLFICGSDNHGTPIVVSAEEAGTTPRELSERYHTHFKETFERMGVIFDHFGMTDNETNHARTQSIINRLTDAGYVYSEIVSQSYCTSCERFLPDRYVEGDCPHCGKHARGDECDQGCGRHLEPGEIENPTCTTCHTRAEMRQQEHYFFRLSRFQDYLLDYLPNLKGTINARNYAIGWIENELRDWCITRTLEWGVRFPGNEDLVVYVWVDAPIGYISFTEEWAESHNADWTQYWCGDGDVTHFIGSDIIYHHCIFWPALLHAAGYGTPDAVVASGMLKVEDQKFSKSRGYVVWANEDYLDVGLPSDYLRYYLLSYTSHTKELNFSWKAFQERVNNELVNTLGNFIYRSLYFAEAKLGGIPATPPAAEILDEIGKSRETIDEAFRAFEFKSGVDGIMALATFGNNHIQKNAPWKLIKDNREAAEAVIADCLQIVKALCLLIEPVMPDCARRAWEMLGYTTPLTDHTLDECTTQLSGVTLQKAQPLFARIENDQYESLESTFAARVEAAKKREQPEKEEIPTVPVDLFAQLDLRVGRILAADPIKGSKKLLKMRVDIGTEERQVVAGIAQFHDPAQLNGSLVVVVTNLEPATIFGVESRGMILAAGDEAALLIPNRDVPPGTGVR